MEPKIKLDEKTTKRVIEFELRGTSLEADHKILENQWDGYSQIFVYVSQIFASILKFAEELAPGAS